MSEPMLHEDVTHLGYLIGTWTGEGAGEYPTIEPFIYGEEVTFFHVGKPWIGYRQRTWDPEGGAPRHSEMGYIRPAGLGRVEWVLAHATGVVEVDEGTVVGGRFELSSRAVTCTATAKEVTALQRTIIVEGDVLRYDLSMAAAGLPLTHHLRAELTRT